MAERRGRSYEAVKISDSKAMAINDEVLRDIGPLLKNDNLSTIIFYRTMMYEFRKNEYDFLDFIDRVYLPRRVLHIFPGTDNMPKHIFGEKQVVESGQDIDLICILDAQIEVIGDNPQVYVDLLKPGGLIAIMENVILNPEDERIKLFGKNKSLKKIKTPEGFGLFRKQG